MPSYAVIGASRGIGLEFVRQLAARPDATVFAVARNLAGSAHLNTAILGLRNVHLVEADVADYATLEYKVNALGPVHAITAFLPLLRASLARKIVVLSAGAAESKFNLVFGNARMAAYGMSKAAALIATTKFAVKLKDEGFVVVSLNPGLVDVSATRTEAANARDSEAIAAFGDRSAAQFGAAFALTSPEVSGA